MAQPPTARHWSDRVGGAAGRLAISAVVGVVVALCLPGHWTGVLRILAGWSGGAGVYLFMAGSVMLSADPEYTRFRCRTDDASRGIVDLLLTAATFVSIGGVGLALRDSQNGTGGGAPQAAGVGIPILAVLCAWLLVHMLYALHYARLFYQNDEDKSGPPAGGIDFHDTDHAKGEKDSPDYRDFLYVSFSIACTYGVTDVELTCKGFRRTVWKHGILSFVFATIVIALAVNVVTNLLSGK